MSKPVRLALSHSWPPMDEVIKDQSEPSLSQSSDVKQEITPSALAKELQSLMLDEKAPPLPQSEASTKGGQVSATYWAWLKTKLYSSQWFQMCNLILLENVAIREMAQDGAPAEIFYRTLVQEYMVLREAKEAVFLDNLASTLGWSWDERLAPLSSAFFLAVQAINVHGKEGLDGALQLCEQEDDFMRPDPSSFEPYAKDWEQQLSVGEAIAEESLSRYAMSEYSSYKRTKCLPDKSEEKQPAAKPAATDSAELLKHKRGIDLSCHRREPVERLRLPRLSPRQ